MTTFHTAGGGTYNLNASISSTATTITLSSFLEPVSNVAYTMALLNTDIVYATISPRTTNSEFISFTGITQNADGTATLTGVVRGLAKKSPFTTSSTFKLPHPGQSVFILSDPPQVFEKYVSLENAETISGLKTFSTTPVSSAGLPTSSTELATKQYVDNTATGTTTINRIVVSGTAGETIAAGNLIYQKAADNRWWLCDADTAATVENVNLGIAQGAGTAGNAITGGVLISGVDSNQSGLTANTKYYASNTAGAISTSAGTTEVSIGFSLSTTSILFTPRYDQQITEDQQDALASTTTPNSTNKYLTQKDFQIGAEISGSTTGSANAYVFTSSPAIAAYSAGMTFRLKANFANTGSATLNVSGLGAKDIKKLDGATALGSGDIANGQEFVVIYDGTNMQLVSPASSFIPAWTDEGSATWSASNADQVITFTNAGKDLYKVYMYFTVAPAGIAILLNAITAANYTYTYTSTNAVATTAGATSMRITDTTTILVAELLIQGKHASGVKSVGAIVSTDNTTIKGILSSDSNNLSSITIKVGAGSSTGKVHAYGLNL